jgi:cyclophilin family peptidyl-prolyl cis-trans isomerase
LVSWNDGAVYPETTRLTSTKQRSAGFVSASVPVLQPATASSSCARDAAPDVAQTTGHPRERALPCGMRWFPLVLLAACGPEPVDPGSSLDEALAPNTVRFETNMGTFVLELDSGAAPNTVANFYDYVDAGFYDGRDGLGETIFHRVISGFVVQAGGFVPGLQGKSTNPTIDYEGDNERGTVAMARTNNPDSATSQFFVNLVDNTALDHADGRPGYTVFGQVIEGMPVIDDIAAVATGTTGGFADVPVDDVIIESVMRGADEKICDGQVVSTRVWSRSIRGSPPCIVSSSPWLWPPPSRCTRSTTPATPVRPRRRTCSRSPTAPSRTPTR